MHSPFGFACVRACVHAYVRAYTFYCAHMPVCVHMCMCNIKLMACFIYGKFFTFVRVLNILSMSQGMWDYISQNVISK